MKKESKKKCKRILIGGIFSATILSMLYLLKINSNLRNTNKELLNDINVFKDFLSCDTLYLLKDTLTRRLRYSKGKLLNGIENGIISETEKILREEEVIFYMEEIESLIDIEDLLKE